MPPLITRHRGLTLLEIVLAIAILTIVAAGTVGAFSDFRARKTLDAGVEEILATFSRAHLDTISSRNNELYGVHIDPDGVVYFIAPTYVAGAPTNSAYLLNGILEITNISANIASAGNNVYFNRLSGTTAQEGTFEVRVKSSTSISTVITINGTGAVSI
jgi:prepilin-type N-terminal cleavage/methylation domain-containing protein